MFSFIDIHAHTHTFCKKKKKSLSFICFINEIIYYNNSLSLLLLLRECIYLYDDCERVLKYEEKNMFQIEEEEGKSLFFLFIVLYV